MEPPPADDFSQDTPEHRPELDLADRAQPASDPPQAGSGSEFVRIKRTHLYVALLPLAFVAGLALGFVFWGQARNVASTQLAPAESAVRQPVRVDVSLDDDPSLGPASAPITIVEFSDFNCPYCKKWQAETFYPLLQAYPDQIHFVYRDFPITSQDSFIAAQAANCAGEQGAYWKFHNALLTGELGLGREAYGQYADLLGIDSQALLACVDSERYADEVEADARYAAGLGISGTPTFFINGIPLVGAQPLEQFTQIIDSELQ